MAGRKVSRRSGDIGPAHGSLLMSSLATIGRAISSRRPQALLPLFVAAIPMLSLSCDVTNDSRERVELWALGREGEEVAHLIPEFERLNPGIDVVVQQIPWTAAHEKLLTSYVGESLPDVAQMGNTWIPEFQAIEALEDLTATLQSSRAIDKSDYFPGIWATNEINGRVYGVPWYVDARVLFYRKDILARAGFPDGPRTWSELSEALRLIKEQKLARHGILLPLSEWEPIVNLALSNGATVLTHDGTRGAFRDPRFAEAFGYYVSMFRNGYAPAVSNSQIANLYQQFAEGDFAMYITGPWNVGEFKKRLPPSMEGKWATAPLPGSSKGRDGVSMAGGSSLVIFRSSKHKAAALKLIEFLSQPAQQVKFYELTGDLPARRSAWNATALANDPYFPAFRKQLENVAPLPQVPEWEQITAAIFDQGEAAARGTVTPEAALATLDARADELLEKRRWMLTKP